MDLSCAHVPSNAPSHRYFTSQKQVICFKTLHANPGAIESQEVDTLKPVFNRKHIVVELLESYAVVGNGTALLLSTSGSRFKVDVQQLFEASRQPVAFNFESCMNIIAPDFMENDTMKMEDLDCLSKALGELWNAHFFKQDLGDHCAEILDQENVAKEDFDEIGVPLSSAVQVPAADCIHYEQLVAAGLASRVGDHSPGTTLLN